MELTDDKMYRASLDKDTRFEGLFFMAVKTTGIFCRPSCTARKPKRENVEFFKTVKECIEKGYRPCKICKPLEKLNETPGHIKQLIDELSDNPSLKFRLSRRYFFCSRYRKMKCSWLLHSIFLMKDTGKRTRLGPDRVGLTRHYVL